MWFLLTLKFSIRVNYMSRSIHVIRYACDELFCIMEALLSFYFIKNLSDFIITKMGVELLNLDFKNAQ